MQNYVKFAIVKRNSQFCIRVNTFAPLKLTYNTDEIIKLYDILRDMDFELTETQVGVFEKLQDAEVNGGFF